MQVFFDILNKNIYLKKTAKHDNINKIVYQTILSIIIQNLQISEIPREPPITIII